MPTQRLSYQQVKDIRGRTTKAITKKANGILPIDNGEASADLPWKSLTKDTFFPPIEIMPDRWKKVYPYRLLVIDVTKDNKIVSGGEGTPSAVEYNQYDTGGVSIRFKSIGTKWEFQLPITPQQITIADQFAITTSAAMKGVVEEHSGIRFKMINIQGTTGIWAFRDSLSPGNLNPSAIESMFSGTIESVNSIVGSIDRIKNTITTGIAASKPRADDPLDSNLGQTTGYYQAQLLQQFLEQYAVAKQDPKNKGWRLVFDYPKENQSFIVTPVSYQVTKSQRSPGEHMFNIQLKAWKRIKLDTDFSKTTNSINQLSPNTFQRIVNSLTEARRLMSNSLNLVKAVRSDFRKPFDALRQATLFVKDLGGVAYAASDMPNQVVSDIQSSIMSYISDLNSAFGDQGFGGVDDNLKKFRDKIATIFKGNEGLAPTDIKLGAIGTTAYNYFQADSINQIFNQPEGYFEFFNSIPLNNLTIAPDQQQNINDQIEIDSTTSIEDLREIRNIINDLALDISNNYGAGDAEFSRIFGRPAPRERSLPMTPEEFEILAALEDVILSLNTLTATRELDDQRRQNPLEYVGGLADDSGIPFESTSPSKYLAPVPYGLTIQQISGRYLKNPDRWIEIATLNNLRSPYIDEEGFSYDFLSNGDGRQFNVSTKENLFVGQKISIYSNTVPSFTRKIIEIERITDTNFLITVDGADNLSTLTIAADAKMKAYLPGTTNSQNQIWIPSNLPADAEPRFFDIPYLNGDTLTGISKIDWLLDDSGDVVLNAFGDLRVANGMTNIIQALKMKVATQKGKLLSYPNYGIGISPGIVTSELDLSQIFNDLQDMIQSDSRFEAIETLEINVLPPSLNIAMTVRLAQGRGIFPINFTINN